jgi:hypothetical protein
MTPDQLWSLLPAALRGRDAETGGVLRALVEVLAEPAAAMEHDIAALADDWFIETCAEWLVPYLGDLVGARMLHPLEGTARIPARARIADTLRLRRRKGTAAMLEEMARTTSGWPAHAVEFFERLSTTQHVNHVRPHAPASAAIRDAGAMELVDGPFDRTPRSADLRAIGPRNGWHNIPNIGLFLWPHTAYPLDRATATPAASPPDGRFRVDPLGLDRAMAAPGLPETAVEQRSDESNLPVSLRRRPLAAELDARRAGTPHASRWFGAEHPAFTVWIQSGPGTPLARVPLDEVFVCDLSNWDRPTGQHVRVDPMLGRVTVAMGRAVHRLAVSWSCAFAGDIGAWPAPRRDPAARALQAADWQIGVSADDAPVPNQVVATLAEAVAAWTAWQAANPGTHGRIVLMDSHRHAGSFTGPNRIAVGQGSRLSVVAARWPQPPGGARRRDAVDPAGVRPCWIGDVEVIGTGIGGRPGEVVLDGVLLAGALRVLAPASGEAGLGRLDLRRCTLDPGAGGIAVAAGNARIAVALDRSITGPIALADEGVALTLTESIVQRPGGGEAIAAPGAALEAAGATVLGRARLRQASATDCVFDDVLDVARRQRGCVRFSYVTPGSRTPRRYRCQPDLARAAAPGDAAVEARLEPTWQALTLAHPGFARLAPQASEELRTGSETGAEMGAHRFVFAPQRIANLHLALEEHLPLGRVAAPLLHLGGQP